MARRARWDRGRGWRRYALAENLGPTGPQTTGKGELEQRLDKLQEELSEIRKLIRETESLKPGGQGE